VKREDGRGHGLEGEGKKVRMKKEGRESRGVTSI